jgi:hypothetical protein
MIWVAGRSPTLVSHSLRGVATNLKATTLAYLAITSLLMLPCCLPSLRKQNGLLQRTSVESCNKTLHFQAGNGPLQPMNQIELPPDYNLYISQLIY